MSDVLPSAPGGAAQPDCPGCGAPGIDGATFCHKCGHPLGAVAPPPLPPDAAAPSAFDAAPAAAPTAPPTLGPSPSDDPPRGTTLPGWGTPSQPPPPQASQPPRQPAAHPPGPSGPPAPSAWPYAPPPPGQAPWSAATHPPPRSGAVLVLAVLGAALVGIALLGVLAAIAIPNYFRYQLRAKASEVPALLAQLDAAETARREAGESYVVFADGLPADQQPGASKLAWSDDDLLQLADLGWNPGEATYARYAVDGLEDDEGNQAIALCAETDLDGDGQLAAWVSFRPALAADGSMVVPPPAAPCSAAAALRDGASLEFDPAVPPGRVVRLSPDDEF